MTKKDLSRVHKLFTDQQKKYVVNSKMSQEEIMHYLMPRPGVVWTWVIENENEKGQIEVSDFFSMFKLS